MTAIEWDVFALQPGGDYSAPEYLATLYDAREKSIRVELDGTGSGSFAINHTSAECTEEILAQGNLVKVRIPEVHSDYIFAFFLETGDFTLVSSDEKGGEMLHFGGRGILSYLEYAVAWSESYITGGQSPRDGVWRAYLAGTGHKPGQILMRMIEEMQDPDRPQQPIPLLLPDFDYSLDSNGEAWIDPDATDEFSYQVGETGLAIVTRLIPTGVTVQMDPDFTLHAYNELGRDLSGNAFGAGVVRFEKGVNIATELRREQPPNLVATHELVAGETDHYGRAALPGAATRVTKETYLASFGTTTAALGAVGLADLKERLRQSDTITFPIANRRTAAVVLADPVSVGSALGPVAINGSYLPGPSTSDRGDFWVGDTVRVHTGTGPFDYDEVNARVEAITITRNDDNAELDILVELKTVPIEPIVQFFTHTTVFGCEHGYWDLPPSAGNLLIGACGIRGGGDQGSGIVPIGNTAVPGTCDPGLDIVGTDWTYIDSNEGGTVAPHTNPITLAYRDAAISEPQGISWGANGRARSHQVEVRGLSGAPTVTVNDQGYPGPGAVFTSPTITVPAAGYIFAILGYPCTGPSDGSSAFFVMTPREAAQTLTQGFQDDYYGGYTWFGYLQVEAAGTYSITLDRSAKPRSNTDEEGWGWLLAFWPS